MEGYLLFVDIETSGIPVSIKSPVEALDQWPYILQIAWKIYDYHGEHIKTESLFVYEKEIAIEQKSEKIHGISIAFLQKNGIARETVMKRFMEDYHKYKPLIIGHFVEFDYKMLQVALNRSHQLNDLKNARTFCTMIASDVFNPLKRGKYLKLEELYNRLFCAKMERTHDALCDVEATAKCYFELANQHFISIGSATMMNNELKKRKSGWILPVLFVVALLIWMIL